VPVLDKPRPEALLKTSGDGHFEPRRAPDAGPTGPRAAATATPVPPWLAPCGRSTTGGTLSYEARRALVIEDGPEHPHDGALTPEEHDLRIALAQGDEEARDLHSWWWIARQPSPPRDDWNELQLLRKEAAHEGGPEVLRIYCRQCGAEAKQQGERSAQAPLGRVWRTKHSLLFQGSTCISRWQ
jgi:hypothetical protein